MDTKITKKRLNDHLSYDWIKYVAIFAVTILLFWLLYDVGATKPTNAQKLEIFVLNGTANDAKLEHFVEDLEKRMNGTDKRPVDDRGYEVFHKDEILEVVVSSFGNYTSDAQISQAVSVRMQGGQESDLILMDYRTFHNFVQTWLVSIDDYEKALKEAIATNWAIVKDYPDVPEGTDAGSIRKTLEKRLWKTISEEYDKFFVDETETVAQADLEGISPDHPLYGKSAGDSCTRYEKYSYRHQKVLPESLDEWQRISDELQQAVNSLDQNVAEDSEKYEEEKQKYEQAKQKFDAAYANLAKEEEKAWGLDVNRFDVTTVKSEWFQSNLSAKRLPWEPENKNEMPFAMGITNFGNVNGTTYFELVKVFNFLIDNYAKAKTV